MADDIQQPVGGLAAASGQPLVDFNQTMVEAQRQALEGQRRLDARREQLISAMNTRKSRAFDPSLMRLAAGLLAPTKTGSFGESLGYGVAGMAEEQEKEFLRQQQEAKLAYEIEVGAEEQRRKNLANQMGLQFMQQFGQPSMPSGESVQLSNVVTPTAGQPVAPRQSFASRVPQQTIYGMSMVEGLKPAAETLMKLREEERKDKIKVKEGNQEREVSTADYLALESALASGDYDFAKKWYAKHGLPWNYVEEKRPDGTVGARRMTDAELEAAKAQAVGQKQELFFVPELGREVPMTPSQYAQYQREGVDYVNKLFRLGAEGKPAGAPSGRNLPPTTSEKEEELTKKKTRAEQQEKTSAQFAQDLLGRSQSAPELRETAEDIMSLSKTNPRVFGLLQQPGLMGAIKRAAQEGLKVPAETLEQYKLTEKDLEALQSADFASSRMQTLLRKLARTPGEGAISDLETRMYSALAVLTKDTPKTVEIKGNLIKARADFDQELHKEFVNYQKATGGDYQDFVANSPEYKRTIANYRTYLKSLRDSNASYFTRQGKSEGKDISREQPEGVDRNNKWLK